jgi:dTDP-4-dehydrorhamnose reductase
MVNITIIPDQKQQNVKIVLYGGNGWIGQQIQKILISKNISYVISQVRVDDVDQIRNELDEVKPTHVICSIGRTKGVIDGKAVNSIDYLEYPTKLVDNVRDNLYSPVILAKLCQDRKIHMTYIGTGCIFNTEGDTSSYNYTEEDKPNFFGSSYSIVKGFTDQLMSQLFSDYILNVRIRMPITRESHPNDFITKIASYPNICSIDNSMTVLDDLLLVLVDMLMEHKTGTINLVNPDYINHNQILTLYKEHCNPNHTWNNITLEQQKQLLKSDRSNNVLDSHKLQDYCPHIPTITESIADILKARTYTS